MVPLCSCHAYGLPAAHACCSREWRLSREREVIQLRRNAQRQNAALQQHQAMHSKQQVRLAAAGVGETNMNRACGLLRACSSAHGCMR